MAELPCDVDGRCMVCRELPEESGLLSCNSCGSPWHISCLAAPPTLPDTWLCPDCLPAPISEGNNAVAAPTTGDLVSKIRAIQEDSGLSEKEKARQRQDLLSRGLGGAAPPEEKNAKHAGARPGNTLDILADNLRCTMCLDLADRPVTTPCGHSSCLRCFKRYVMQGKKTCDKCRAPLPLKMIAEPRINSALVIAIRLAKSGESAGERAVTKPSVAYLENEKRPDKAFRTERAVKPGKANACSGRVFVTVPPDHFGPILAEHVAEGGQVVYVGTSWEDRMECRQSGVHLPHVAGIAGQADYGAQSVALSGGYEDDEDHGDWFLYTGSGGRDLSGNKRTNKQQSFDQKFDKTNEALRLSCRQGYPVRVVRSHKEKRSSYAPENGVRYDGIYRIEKCWRKKGVQGFRVCRYLFVRCDNDPAPWTSDAHGDRPRPLPLVQELKGATDVSERKKEAFWEWNSETEVWGWAKAPPESQKEGIPARSEKRKRKDQIAEEKKVLKQFGCGLCHRILELPLSTPCGHNFCQSCLRDAFNSPEESRPKGGGRTRTLRERKPVRRCPTCKADISESYSNLQVNRHMESIIESVTKKMKAEQESNSTEEECMEETEV